MRDRIKLIQTQRNMSQVQFANETGISTATLSGIYTGRTQPTNAIISRIHDRFPEISIAWLMFGEGSMESTLQSENASASDREEGLQATSDTLSTVQGMAFGGGQTAASVAGVNPAQTFQTLPLGATIPSSMVSGVVKNTDKPMRKITEIRVFFDDGTFETFG